jgi:glucose/arabinose dehydrogenase
MDFKIITDFNDVIWGFDFISQNQVIFTGRAGSMNLLDLQTSAVTNISGVPNVNQGGEGGMLDLKLHPDFSSNHLVYFCYTDGSSNSKTQSLGRAELQGNTLVNFQRIFNTGAPNGASNHFGCRILFQGSGIFLSVGEQTDASQAQNPDSFLGKIVHMNDDGSNLTIWSSGHRNPQGLAIDPASGKIFSSEHGPTGGDELNIIEKNQNYGWPRVTRGQPAGDLGETAPGFIDPLLSWTPSIAPSGITFYTGNIIPQWKGNLFIACLVGRQIRRLVIENARVTFEEVLFESIGARFRNVGQGPDGYLYFSTDDGKFGRIIPKQ